MAELFRFRELYKENASLDEVFPDLARAHPRRYAGMGLADHCREMHEYIRGSGLLGKMVAASRVLPVRRLSPAEAYRAIVRKNVEFVPLDRLDPASESRTSAVMVVPYPPGIPILLGGEALDARSLPILEYLRAREEFERRFPGYEGEIHGIDTSTTDAEGARRFELMLVKEGS